MHSLNPNKNQEVDIWLIRDNLTLSYEQRLAQHQNTLDCIDELKHVGKKHRAQSTKSPQVPHQKPA